MDREKHSLLLVQVDDLRGEMVGEAITTLMSIGAANVQVISTITKKNRAGYILLIDCPEANVERVGQYLQRELLVGGYHILASTHIAQQSMLVKKKVVIQAGDRSLESECAVKILGSKGDFYSVKPEHGSIIRLKNRIKSELGINISTQRLESILGSLLQEEFGDSITAKLL